MDSGQVQAGRRAGEFRIKYDENCENTTSQTLDTFSSSLYNYGVAHNNGYKPMLVCRN